MGTSVKASSRQQASRQPEGSESDPGSQKSTGSPVGRNALFRTEL